MGSLGECRKCGANERNKAGDCLPCRRAATRKWREKNPDKVKDYSRSYYAQHQERIVEYQRQHGKIDSVAAKKKEKAKEKYLRHKPKMSQKTQEWRTNSPAEYLLSAAKQRARRGELPFNIDVTDIVIPECCPLLGIRLVAFGGKRTDATPSLDRIETMKGYVKGNIWVISWRANRLKCDATLDELRGIVAGLENATRLRLVV